MDKHNKRWGIFSQLPRRIWTRSFRRWGLSPFLGGIYILGFAPFYWFPVPILALAGLFACWDRMNRKAAALSGFAFGFAFFVVGVSWVFVSLHDLGGMPVPLAVLATLLFCALLALFPAAAGYLSAGSAASSVTQFVLLIPASWTLAEWLRGHLFTGFPWLAIGYSQTPYSWLAGYAPLLGVYGVTWIACLSACLLALLFSRGVRPVPLMALVVIWGTGLGLQRLHWTAPVGHETSVRLLQGNIAQNQKWQQGQVKNTLDTYLRLAEHGNEQLVVLPETALPLFQDQLPSSYLGRLSRSARQVGGTVLYGVPERQIDGTTVHYYNSVKDSSSTQVYRKFHLVPFGEFIPPGFSWVTQFLRIPLTGFSRGDPARTLVAAGQRIAVSICYEDAFGEELIQRLPESSLLVNVSNDAWFGHSFAAAQQLQMSQTRALETGRQMVRATNTGITAIINEKGEVEAQLPQFTTAVLTGWVKGFKGSTPYVDWGNSVILALLGLSWGGAMYSIWRGRSRT